MKKAGDIRKRSVQTLIIIGMFAFSAEIETVDKVVFAAETEPKLEVEVEEISGEHEETEADDSFNSTMQESYLIGNIEDKLSIIEEKWNKLLTNDCEERERLELEIESQLMECENIQKDIYSISCEEKIESFRKKFESKMSVRKKLESFEITQDMDMSSVIGLTEVEIKYILLSVTKETGEHLLTDEWLASELAIAIAEGAEMYQVNEIFSIGVVIWETRWLTNENAKNNNFGSLRRSEEEGYLKFDTVREGMLKTVSSIRNNMKDMNTASEISHTYCMMSEEENQKWAANTVRLMKTVKECAVR